MPRLLLIDDDVKLAEVLADYMARFGLELASATHPGEGLEKLHTEAFDLVILDVMLPDMDGFEVCKRIRKDSDMPIIMLTARGEVMDRVVGLELGADDYLPKPFEPRELVARIQSILKRTTAHDARSHALEFGELSVSLDQRKAKLSGKELELTTSEFHLLALLATSPGKIYTRDEIINRLKGTDAAIYSRAVDILISRLRQKLKPLECIRTIWGSGYSFIPPGD